jgi:hypothetical protein
MRFADLRLRSFVPLALLALTATAITQDKPSGLLNSLEVQQLVARSEPADHARLSAHFRALADRYVGEAKRHTSMSQNYIGNPSRNLSTGMSVHCKRLADLNTQSATSARDLATYHEKLAGGAPASPPPDSGRLESGAGAPAPTEKELNALAAKASTPAEHRALAEYFQTLAKRYTTEGNQHVAFAQSYRGTRIAQAAVHHDRLAERSRDAAKEASEAAAMHNALVSTSR